MFPPLKPKMLQFRCKNCNNVSNIPETWKNNIEGKKPIDLAKGMYLLLAFKYSKY